MYNFTMEQRDFLNSSGKVVLHACPGSGKTTVVAQKVIDYLKCWNRPHKGIAILSFTNVASEEIAHHVKEILPRGSSIDVPHFIGTLDSFIDNYIFLRFGYLLLSSPKRPIIATNAVARSYRFWRGECHRNKCVTNIDCFKWDSNNQLTKNGIPITCTGTGRYEAPCIEYKKHLLDKGVFFQNEISSLSCLLLKSYPDIAKSVADRFPVIILDEAQDTSTEQMEILDILCDAGLESMYIVGDPDQAIYEWRTANPESFLRKMEDEQWRTLTLSENFRSSQLICNATYLFSDIFKNGKANKASGKTANCGQKPVLCLYDKGTDKNIIIDKFKDLCSINEIELSAQNLAVVTRGRIHADNDISELWKTPETEFLAKASYEWLYGNKKRAYNFCEKAIFQLTIKNYDDVHTSIEEEISKIMSHDLWKSLITDILINLPSANENCGDWTSIAQSTVSEILTKSKVTLIEGISITEAIKIKSRDKNNPDFKKIPIKNFFEKKTQTEYTLSSVHGVKGETYDALMLLVENDRGNTLTPSFLATGDTSKELMRIAYVAMTRPRKLLMVAMPKSRLNLSNRFPKEKWDYTEL